MFKLEDLYFHPLVVALADFAIKQLVPTFVDPGAGNLIGQSFDDYEFVEEQTLFGLFTHYFLVFGQFGDLIQQGFHEETSEALVIIDRILRDHEKVLIEGV